MSKKEETNNNYYFSTEDQAKIITMICMFRIGLGQIPLVRNEKTIWKFNLKNNGDRFIENLATKIMPSLEGYDTWEQFKEVEQLMREKVGEIETMIKTELDKDQ